MGQVSGKSIFENNLKDIDNSIAKRESTVTPRYDFAQNWNNLCTITKQQMCI